MLGFGLRYTARDSLPPSDDMDFVNHIFESDDDAYQGFPEYELIIFAVQLWLKDRWLLETNVNIYDDLIPQQFTIYGGYALWYRFGIKAGYNIENQYLTSYDQYFRDRYGESFFLVDPNAAYRNVQENSWMVVLFWYPNAGPFHAEFSLNGGVTYIGSFDYEVAFKQRNSNFTFLEKYQVKPSPSFFIHPLFSLNLDLFHFKKAVLGFRGSAAYYFTNRQMKYTKTTSAWTVTNSLTEDVVPVKHRFIKKDFSFGLYLQY